MRIQFVSDLHLEFPVTGGTLNIQNVEQRSDVLVLAGDICVAWKIAEFRDFFAQCADRFPRVIYLAGNHEFYHDDIERAHDKIHEGLAGIANLTYCNNTLINLGSHDLFGASLWTDCNRGDHVTKLTLAASMNDYRLISWKSRSHWKLRPSDTEEIHHHTKNYLMDVLAIASRPLIVVTHHAPSKRSTHARYANNIHMNGGYSSDLEEDFMFGKYDIPLWIHGHTHHSFDYAVGGTRVVCNPRGYVTSWHLETENSDFDIQKVIEL